MLNCDLSYSQEFNDRFWSIAWNKQGNILATAGEDKTLTLWNFNEHKRAIRSISWSPCGSYIATASFDSCLNIWRVSNANEISLDVVCVLEGHTSEVKSIAWSVNGRYIASCGRDKSVWVWEFDDEEDASCSSVLILHRGDVKSVNWHDTEEVFASCGFDGLVKIYNEQLDDWAEAISLEGHQGTVWCARFQPNNLHLLLATCGDDCTIKIWSSPLHYREDKFWNRYCCVKTLSHIHSLTIYHLSWSSCGSYLASASADNSFSIILIEQISANIETNEMVQHELLVRKFDVHEQDINCVEFRPHKIGSSQPTILATSSDDLTIRFWNFK